MKTMYPTSLTTDGILLLILGTGYVLLALIVFALTWQWVLFAGGVGIGIVVLLADKQWLHRYYQMTPPSTVSPTSPIEVQTALVPYVATRSVLFLLTYMPLSLFVITSTKAVLGKGLVMGIGLVILYELWQYRQTATFFRQYFFRHLNHPLSSQDIFRFILGATGFWMILNAILFF